MKKGLSVSIYTNKEYGTCSNNGISSRFSSSSDFYIAEIFEVSESMPEVVIIKREHRMFKDVIAVPKLLYESWKSFNRWTLWPRRAIVRKIAPFLFKEFLF